MLSGHLKSGGHVRVIVAKDEEGREKLSFEILEGPVTPKPEKLPSVRPKAKRRASPRSKPKGDGGNKRGTVPKVPMIKAKLCKDWFCKALRAGRAKGPALVA